MPHINPDQPVIRSGSPFKLGTATTPKHHRTEFNSSQNYIASGSVLAALLILFFELVAAVTFSEGALLIAVLGVCLSFFGIQSSRKKAATTLLLIHLVILIACYREVMT